ncbi:CPBP family intramembrane glutamic endopeptidase [Cardinium endosymbiont of Sogatella furcifera]|uniref:CPBP family intramembrane glutamic endopeptidase n=1 Tax=Cardinium endosymbiont of Sogatella furcifera TaxID=650378 RepID=UPI0013B3A537|nr:CPBP family intramembrane glutamic endopeptidase [Cardinium endosymbiont of Sogatella furcifera]
MQPTHYLNHATLKHCMVRIIICCIAWRYYLHLQAKQGRKGVTKPCAHRYRWAIDTILVQLMMTFALILLSSIQKTLGHPSLQPALDFNNSIDFVCRGIVEITCLAAILEELLFRGVLEQLLRKITPSRLWITMISALAFSFMHCNMSNNLLYFVMGCFLSYLYHQTNHIIYPIIAHGLHNLCATSIIYLTLDTRLALTINSLTIVTRTILTIGTLLVVYGYTTYIIGQKTKDIN